MSEKRKEKIALVGSGNWGSVVAIIAGNNAAKYSDQFDPEVRMWVYEEMVGDRKLTEIINTEHENVKYLPGIPLPHNVVADPDLLTSVKGATLLIFVLPHQFIKGVCGRIKESLEPGTRAISLIKGVDADEEGLRLITDVISTGLGIDTCVLCGANVANDVAKQEFNEATIGYKNRENGELWKTVFDTPYFHINTVPDVSGVELCGALKNIVAIGAGISDGLGWGGNTKAAIMRLGMQEMIRFAKTFYSGVQDATFFESCGLADLITTCYGGRNRKVSEAFCKTGKTFEELEAEMLNGQKLQGTGTAADVFRILSKRGLLRDFPLFTSIYRICFEKVDPRELLTFYSEVRESSPKL